MLMKTASLLALCLPLLALQALPKVAVLDIAAQKGLDASVVVPITESLMEEIVGAKTYVVLDRAYVDRVLSEQEFDASALVADIQIAQAGQFLGADYVIAGKVQMLGDSYFLVAKTIEVRTGIIVSQASAQGEGKLTALLDMARSIGKRLLAASPVSSLAVAAGAEATKIGLSFSEVASLRWRQERDEMAKLLEAGGFEVIAREAGGDARRQDAQVRELAGLGVKVLAIVAADGRALAPTVDEVASQGVKVIAYDRLIPTAAIAAYVSFDNVDIGRNQAKAILAAKGSGDFVLLGGSPNDNNARLFRAGQMEVLRPYIDFGKIKVVADDWVQNWDPGSARKIVANILEARKGRVDAVVSSNDGTALAVVEALRVKGLAGKVPVSGQDASEAGCNSVARGELTVTILKDARKFVPLVCDYMAKLARDEAVLGLSFYSLAELTGDRGDSGTVSCLFVPALQVTKDSLKRLVVDSGYLPYESVYRGVKDAPAK